MLLVFFIFRKTPFSIFYLIYQIVALTVGFDLIFREKMFDLKTAKENNRFCGLSVVEKRIIQYKCCYFNLNNNSDVTEYKVFTCVYH